MGCFLGCFRGDKDRLDGRDPRSQRDSLQNVACWSEMPSEVEAQQGSDFIASKELVPELLYKPDVLDQGNPSHSKRVTFNSNILRDDHDPHGDDASSLQEKESGKALSPSPTLLKDEHTLTTSAGCYPPNHRYHNARDSDDEAEYGGSDSELDDLEDDSKVCEENDDSRNSWSEPFALKFNNAKDSSEFSGSAIKDAEDVSQSIESKLNEVHVMKPHKENLVPNIDTSHASIDASLSNWLPYHNLTTSQKTGLNSSRSICNVENRPILGALSTPIKKSMKGSVEDCLTDSGSTQNSGSASFFKGIPNTTSKYREDKEVKWHSTPFVTRLDKVLGRGTAET